MGRAGAESRRDAFTGSQQTYELPELDVGPLDAIALIRHRRLSAPRGDACYTCEMMVTENTDQSAERLQKVLSRAGLGSRRAVEAMMRAGRVSVNGSPAVLGQKVGPGDEVRVDGRRVATRPERPAYYALHKPYGVVTSASDDEGRTTVVSLVTVPERVYPVGRLDVDS